MRNFKVAHYRILDLEFRFKQVTDHFNNRNQRALQSTGMSWCYFGRGVPSLQTTTGDPSRSSRTEKSKKMEGASTFSTLKSTAATARISSSPRIEPRTRRKYRNARAFALITILVSVALGRTLRAAERIARRHSRLLSPKGFLWLSRSFKILL